MANAGINYFRMSLGNQPIDLSGYRRSLKVSGSDLKLIEDALNRIKAASYNESNNRWVTLYFGVALDHLLKEIEKHLPRLFHFKKAIAREYFSLKTTSSGMAHKPGFVSLPLLGKQSGREVLFFGMDRRFAVLWQIPLPEAHRFMQESGVAPVMKHIESYANFIFEIIVRCSDNMPWVESMNFTGSRGFLISKDRKEIFVPRKLLDPSTLKKLQITQFIAEYLIRLEVDPFRGFVGEPAVIKEVNGEIQVVANSALRRVSGKLKPKFTETSIIHSGDSMPVSRKRKG